MRNNFSEEEKMTGNTDDSKGITGQNDGPTTTLVQSGVEEKTKIQGLSDDTLNLIRILICLALIFPIFQLYFTIPAAISMWVSEQYVPFVNMVYFILIILGGFWLLRFSFRFSGERKER
jgi:hypothetical protein